MKMSVTFAIIKSSINEFNSIRRKRFLINKSSSYTERLRQ